jgi:ribose/xylose/arabinose/galactoside ABC-type transport system permease subunit
MSSSTRRNNVATATERTAVSAPVAVREALRRTFVTLGLPPFLLAGVFAYFAIDQPRFVSYLNITNMGQQATYLMVITMGQMLVLLSRNYDLSVGSTVALVSVVTAKTMTGVDGNTAAIVLGVLAGMGVGIGVGLVNGLVVAIFRVSSFMVTFGMLQIAFGLALLLSSGTPIVGLPNDFVFTLGVDDWLSIPVSVWLTLGLLVLFYILLNWTRLGRNAYAIGGNENAARLSGVPVGRNLVYLFALCSFLTALSGIMLTARTSTGEANIGSQYPLQSIAACALGGISLFGGEGRLSGAVIGVCFIIVLSNGMDLVNISSYIQLIVLGSLLIVALIGNRLQKRLAT